MDDPQKEEHLKDIVDLDENTLSVKEIERIAENEPLLKKYEQAYKDRIYTLILLSLTHESFENTKAKNLWENILSHMKLLNRKLGRNVGITVACLDYMTNIVPALAEPKIIEEQKSGFVTDNTTVDQLTGLYLKEVFTVILKKEVEESNRGKTPVSLLMIDIDDFKVVNDTHGHQAGDCVLEKLGKTVLKSIRDMDFAARYGGEELAVIMPGTPLKQAHDVARRIRKNVEKMRAKDIAVTVSIGVAQSGDTVNTVEDLVEKADKRLYEAKERGKNRVV
ncbi:MAG TPA: GGDEF domain-containing protein [Desulfobacteraceae bacterium]|nr:GGDEF domain-containing protein [Desulfobacteraceae bacterium]